MSLWGLTNFQESEKGKKKLSISIIGTGWQILYLFVQYLIILILEIPSRYLVHIELQNKLKLQFCNDPASFALVFSLLPYI